MAEDGKIIYKVVIDNNGAASEAEKAGQSAGSSFEKGVKPGGGAFKEVMVGAARQIGASFVNMAADAGRAAVDTMKAAVDSVASLEQNVGGVETLFKDSADTVIANSKRAYETAGLSANDYLSTVTSFSASLLQSLGGDTEKAAQYADMAIIDMSDNANKMGSSMESIQNAYQGFAKQNYTMLDNLKLGYGGTKSEMERLVEDAEKLSDTFTAQRDASGNLALSYSDVVDAIHIVQENMGITGTTAKEASETIEGSMNAAKAAYDNFLNGSIKGEEFAETIITAAHNIADNVVTIAEGLGQKLPGLITRLAQELPEFVQQIGPPLFDIVKDIIGTLVQLFIEGLPDMLDAGLSLFEEVLHGISEGIPNILPVIVEVIAKIVEALANHAPEILAAGIDIITALITGIADATPKLVEEMPKIVVSLVSSLIKNLPKIIEAGIKLIGALITGVGQASASLLKLFPEYIDEICNFFKNTDWKKIGSDIIEAITNGVKAVWGQLKETFGGGIEELKGVFDRFIEGVKNSFVDLVDTALNWGQELLDNFLGGIRAKWEDLKGAFGKLADKIADYIGFSEPKEGPLHNFHTFAPDMMDLYAKGIRDNVKTVTAELGKLAFEAKETLTTDVVAPDFSSSGFARAVSYDINSSRSSYNTGGTTNYITVNGIDELEQVVNWYQSREIMGRMA